MPHAHVNDAKTLNERQAAASSRVFASRISGASIGRTLRNRVSPKMAARTDSDAGSNHGSPYMRRANRGRDATAALAGRTHSGRRGNGIGGDMMRRMLSRAPGV